MPPTGVHFNGSVNLADAETVMREISERIPAGVRRMTDGETGERGYWILFQIQKFLKMPEFEPVGAAEQAYETEDDAPAMPQIKLREGASADTIEWPDLGYATEYGKSFEIFDRLQQDGTIADGVRFQLQYPTPIASTSVVFVPEDMEAVTGSYEPALFADLGKALAALPHDRIAVQWDVAVEFGLLEGAYGPAWPLEQIVPGLVRASIRCPPTSPPACTSATATTATSTSGTRSRCRCRWTSSTRSSPRPHGRSTSSSFTVPQSRDDADYFAPLANLNAPDTELYLALVPYHPAEQAEGTTETQIAHIDSVLDGRAWGICTECGMGRADREDVPTLLDLHSSILGKTAATA